MHILVLQQYYRIPGAAGSSRFNEMARHWSAAGHRVTVVAGSVRQSTGEASPRFLDEANSSEGIQVRRTYTRGGNRGTFHGRLEEYLSYAASATVEAALRVQRPDVVVASSPPLVVGLPGVAAASLRDTPLVFEVRDLWPDFAVELGMLRNGAARRLAYALESFCYRRAAKVVGVTPAFLRRLEAKGVPRGRLAMIPNGADLDSFAPGPRDVGIRRERGWGDRFVAAYVGAHGPSYALDQVVEAAALLRDRAPDVLVALVGDGLEKQRLVARASSLGLENVDFLPEQPRERVPALIRAADAGISVLKRVEGFRHVYPTKVFDYWGCARPVVLGVEGEAADLVRRAEGGICVTPEEPAELAAAILRLRDDAKMAQAMGWNGHRFAREHFDRRVLAHRYLDLLEEVVASWR